MAVEIGKKQNKPRTDFTVVLLLVGPCKFTPSMIRDSQVIFGLTLKLVEDLEKYLKFHSCF